MSGLEIAGVVLGSLPLVISALEHYANGINTAKRFWRYKSEVRSLILQIHTEQAIFTNTMEQLLTGIVPIQKMTEFVASPGGHVWAEADVEKKLRDRLRSAFDVYLDNVKGIDRALKAIMKTLALDQDGKPQFSDPNMFKQEYKRLRFSLLKQDYAEQLSDLRNFNQALTRLTKQSRELEPTRSEVTSLSCPNFSALQKYARILFDTLLSGSQCCRNGHAVKLRLENRHTADSEEELLEKEPFRVILTNVVESDTATFPTFQKWKEADIRHLIDDTGKSAALPTTHSCPPVARTKKRVQFSQVQVQQSNSSSSSSSTLTLVQRSMTPTTLHVPEHIQNLCKVIGTLDSTNQKLCIGYLKSSLNHKHGIFPLEPSKCQQMTVYSLRQVLTRRANINRRLTQTDKLRVAVHLASSVLQLYKTPWLDEQWSDNDVYFIHRPEVAVQGNLVAQGVFTHPFVYHKFCHSALPTTTSTPSPMNRVIRNRSLFTLGILLIELWYGKPIEELQIARDADCEGTPGVAWCTAERLIEDEIEYDAGPKYREAVRRCIRCDFNKKDSSLDNEEFQKAVYEGVVMPLEKTLKGFTSLD